MVPSCLAALRGAAGPVRQAAVEYRLAPRPPTSQARPASPPLPISSPLDPRYDSTVIPNSNPENRTQYLGGCVSGVGSHASRAITPGVSPRKGRSGPGTSGTCEILRASQGAFAGAAEGA